MPEDDEVGIVVLDVEEVLDQGVLGRVPVVARVEDFEATGLRLCLLRKTEQPVVCGLEVLFEGTLELIDLLAALASFVRRERSPTISTCCPADTISWSRTALGKRSRSAISRLMRAPSRSW